MSCLTITSLISVSTSNFAFDSSFAVSTEVRSSAACPRAMARASCRTICGNGTSRRSRPTDDGMSFLLESVAVDDRPWRVRRRSHRLHAHVFREDAVELARGLAVLLQRDAADE